MGESATIGYNQDYSSVVQWQLHYMSNMVQVYILNSFGIATFNAVMKHDKDSACKISLNIKNSD